MNVRAVTIASLVLYLGVLVGVGIWSRRKQHGFSEYVTGGGAIPAWMLALSFMANFISSNSFVGHSAKSFQTGLVWCLVGAIMVVCCAISWHVFAPRFAAFARAHDAMTLPDFFFFRFQSSGLAALVNWIVVFATLIYILAVLRGTALVLAGGLGVSDFTALLVLYGVTVAYCMLGGLWADVSTDVLQSVILTAGAVALFFAVLLAPAVEGIEAAAPIAVPPIGLVLAVGVGGGVKLLADPKQVMVFYAFRDEAAARRFRWVGPILLLVVYACLFPLGFMARRLVGGAPDLEKLIPSLVFERQILGPWFGGLFVIALLAASMSSLDSAYLVVASCIEKHVIVPAFGGKPRVWRTRLVLLAVATLTVLLSIRPLGGIIALTTFAGALAAALLPAICAGFTRRTIPTWAVALSVVAGVAGAAFSKLAEPWLGIESPWIQDVFLALLFATAPLVPFLAATGQARPGALPSS